MTGEQLTRPEPYWAGIRRRIRDGILMIGSLLASVFAIYAVYGVTGSSSLALTTAVLCGVGTERVVSLISPIVGIDDILRSGKAIWLFLMIPCLLILAAVLIYSVLKGFENTSLFGAALAGWLLGSIASTTQRVAAGKPPA